MWWGDHEQTSISDINSIVNSLPVVGKINLSVAAAVTMAVFARHATAPTELWCLMGYRAMWLGTSKKLLCTCSVAGDNGASNITDPDWGSKAKGRNGHVFRSGSETTRTYGIDIGDRQHQLGIWAGLGKQRYESNGRIWDLSWTWLLEMYFQTRRDYDALATEF
jgi:hypothetical protein